MAESRSEPKLSHPRKGCVSSYHSYSLLTALPVKLLGQSGQYCAKPQRQFTSLSELTLPFALPFLWLSISLFLLQTNLLLQGTVCLFPGNASSQSLTSLGLNREGLTRTEVSKSPPNDGQLQDRPERDGYLNSIRRLRSELRGR